MERKKLIMLTEIAIFSGLGFILDIFSFNFMPQGGGIGIKIIPILIISYRWGFIGGIISGIIISCLNLTTGFVIIHWAQVFMDYFLANLVIAFAGLFRKALLNTIHNSKKIVLTLYITISVLLVNALRYMVYVLSGVVFFSQYAEGQNVWIYSFRYNATFMIPETILVTVVMILLLAAKPDFIISKYAKQR